MNLDKIVKESADRLKKLNLLADVDIVITNVGISRGYYEIKNGNHKIVISRLNPFSITKGHIRKPCDLLGIKMSEAESMKAVIFHEYGHAYISECLYKKFNEYFIEKFQSLFGDINNNERSCFDPDIHISEYAAQSPEEDFCECFMHFACDSKQKNYPGKQYSNGINDKIKFIRSLSNSKDRKITNVRVIK